jgi:hypothetical protein
MIQAFSLAPEVEIPKFDKLQLQNMMMDYWQKHHGSQEQEQTMQEELAREQAAMNKMWSMDRNIDRLRQDSAHVEEHLL